MLAVATRRDPNLSRTQPTTGKVSICKVRKRLAALATSACAQPSWLEAAAPRSPNDEVTKTAEPNAIPKPDPATTFQPRVSLFAFDTWSRSRCTARPMILGRRRDIAGIVANGY